MLAWAGSAEAVEPWSDPDPATGPPPRLSLGASTGFRGAAEYRANAVAVRPLDLSSLNERHYSAIEHRLRLDAGIDWEDKVRLMTSTDVLDGVLWGDNGTVFDNAQPTTGANIGTVNTSVTGQCVNLKPGQPFTEGASVSVNDGDGRRNRFGFARRGNSVDRILFATKPLEGFKPKEQRDRSETKGLFLIFAYDRLVTDDPQRFKDDLHGVISAVRWLEPEHTFGTDLEARLFHSYRGSRANDTNVHAVGGRLMSKLRGDFSAGIEGTFITGSTREVSEAFRVISNDPAIDQTLRQIGGRAVVRYDRPLYTLYLEGDYASGDSDPNVRSPLTQFRFADDTNVGLLLFEHVLAYQSARAAAAGVALLRDLGAPSYPTDQVATRGAFTNAMALFPQADFRPVENLLLRGGVLFAWAPSKVVDPLRSIQRRDGNRVEDDLVNFNGGGPNRYYGTELDLRVQYRMFDHFAADLEGAVLSPGSALEDANGDAVNSWLTQARGTFFF
jgi:hypothetical protein